MKRNFLKVEDDVLYSIVQEYGRDKKLFDEDVEIVTKWLQEQPHLPEVLDKRFVQNFLFLNKFSIEKTKQKIDMYFTVRSKMADVFEKINPKLANMKEFRQIGYVLIHPKTFDNNSVWIFKVRNKKMVEKLDPYDFLRHLINIQEIRMKEDVSYGEYVIIDCRHVPISFALKLTPTFIYKGLSIIYQKLYSARLKAVYVINFPKFAETALSLIKKIMKPKLVDRIKFCPDIEVLKEVIPKECLPVDLGGIGYTLEQIGEMLEEKFVEYQSWFDHLDTLQVDEKLRPESLKNDEILGFHGNFRKLDVD